MDMIPWEVVAGGGAPSALLGFAVWMVLTGRLVTRERLDEMRAAKDDWKKVAEESQEAIRLYARAADARSLVDETVVKTMRAIQEQGERKSAEGGDDS